MILCKWMNSNRNKLECHLWLNQLNSKCCWCEVVQLFFEIFLNRSNLISLNRFNYNGIKSFFLGKELNIRSLKCNWQRQFQTYLQSNRLIIVILWSCRLKSGTWNVHSEEHSIWTNQLSCFVKEFFEWYLLTFRLPDNKIYEENAISFPFQTCIERCNSIKHSQFSDLFFSGNYTILICV